MVMIKQGGAIGGDSHRWVRAAGERAGLRRVGATIRRRRNDRPTV
jgi:hypothetical protein